MAVAGWTRGQMIAAAIAITVPTVTTLLGVGYRIAVIDKLQTEVEHLQAHQAVLDTAIVNLSREIAVLEARSGVGHRD